MDEGAKKRFLQKERECEDLQAAVRIGRIVGERIVRAKVGERITQLKGQGKDVDKE